MSGGALDGASRPIEIHKFGGTSVGSAERIRGAASLVLDAASGARVVVVSSAMSRVTDTLLAAAADASRRDASAARGRVAELESRHLDTLEGLGGDAAAAAEVRAVSSELLELLDSVAILGELTARTRDRVLAAGEKLAVRLLAVAIRRAGGSAVPVDADTFLETDASFGEANPVLEVADRTTQSSLLPLLAEGIVPVVTGFVGRAPDGATTTLGRGGSDFSATLLGAALGVASVTIWTDVEGVFTANPRVVPEARVVPQLNYREAAELSYYGAKVLHQRTMIPVARRGIPVLTRSSFDPSATGTVVDGRYTPGSHPVKAISAIAEHALVSVEGKGMAGVPGVAARVFGALARHGISVTMICQSSSESSICLAVPASAALPAEAALKRELASEMARGDVEEIVVRRGVSLVASVGLGMAHTPGVAARTFTAVASREVNVLAIAQGSSELNISMAVEDRDADRAIRAIHEEFGLSRLDTGEDTTRRLDLMLLGCGNIGRALAELVLDRRSHLFERFGLQARIVAVADRTGYLLRPSGLSREEIAAVLAAKRERGRLRELPGAAVADRPEAMVRAALAYRLARPILVDVSDSDDSMQAFLAALELGADVVTANKKPLAGPSEASRQLHEVARQRGRLLRAEATVGAGLPVVDTLDMLLATGDRIREIEGCFSGTLGFLFTRMEEGASFTSAVAEAIERGYTEPDPVVDLSGQDVARKALILGRLSGLSTGDDGTRLEGLVPPELAGLHRAELMERLAAHDGPMAVRLEEARRDGATVRFVARVSQEGIEVGPRAVPRDSAIGMLRGTDNVIVFRTERYESRPLVITGPGAGVDVTAMGVLSDVLRIAAERGRR